MADPDLGSSNLPSRLGIAQAERAVFGLFWSGQVARDGSDKYRAEPFGKSIKETEMNLMTGLVVVYLVAYGLHKLIECVFKGTWGILMGIGKLLWFVLALLLRFVSFLFRKN